MKHFYRLILVLSLALGSYVCATNELDSLYCSMWTKGNLVSTFNISDKVGVFRFMDKINDSIGAPCSISQDVGSSSPTKSTSKPLTVERNHIVPMSPLEVVPQSMREIHYTATAKVEPYRTNVFGANIVSNEWDSATGKGVIIFDSTVTEIGGLAFHGCSSLTSITIPDGITPLGIAENPFSGCSSLEKFEGKFASEDGRCLIVYGILNSFAPVGLTKYTIPDGVTEIGWYAFSGCSRLTSITIPDIVTKIGRGAFSGCSSLESITIPEGVTTIGDGAFSGCSSLESITIPVGVTTIGDGAFWYCSSLECITIPDSVTEIGDFAFSGCFFTNFINKSSLDAEISNYWEATLCDIIQEDGLCINGTTVVGCKTNATSVTIPDSVTEIGDSAFKWCSSLTSITIPDSVTEIGEDAFDHCTSLTSITIPDSVTKIGSYAFMYCTSLTSITIPDSVTKIGSYAFMYCTSLTSVYCKAVNPPVATLRGSSSWNAFYSNADGRKIYVPTESVEAYKAAAGWSEYVSDIVGYDFE